MIQLTNNLIRDTILTLGLPTPEPNRLHLLGIRGAKRLGPATITRVEGEPNRYDDVLVVFGTHLEVFAGSVDPGRVWTGKPLNPRGCAHLADGAYSFVRGLHRGKPALVQGGPMLIWRDADRDGVRDPMERARWENGIGLNLHAGGTGEEVDAWSAGCQVMRGGYEGNAWKRFMSLIEASGQSRFRYWLVSGSRLVVA